MTEKYTKHDEAQLMLRAVGLTLRVMDEAMFNNDDGRVISFTGVSFICQMLNKVLNDALDTLDDPKSKTQQAEIWL